MAKLIIMKGLPASGKTTRAKEILSTDGNVVRVNKDELRPMLHGDRGWSPKQEGRTIKAQEAMVRGLLEKGECVLVDDTNLNPKRFEAFIQIARDTGSKIQVEDLTGVDIKECIQRDSQRPPEESVGQHVIMGMALTSGLISNSKIIICDLDGTLADIRHRLPYIKSEPRDYKKFFSEVRFDTFRYEIWEQVKQVWEDNEGAEIYFVSGRSDICRNDTTNWIIDYTEIYRPNLFMRRHGDHRPDTLVKEEMYNRYFKNQNVIKVFDDRPSVVRMWQGKGLDVVDCGSGEEF